MALPLLLPLLLPPLLLLLLLLLRGPTFIYEAPAFTLVAFACLLYSW